LQDYELLNDAAKAREIEEAFGGDLLAYSSVGTASRQKLCVEDLHTGNLMPLPDMGSFNSGLDWRMRQVEIQINLGQKQTWTYSLDSKNMECRGCQQHNNMVAFPRLTGSGCWAGRQVIWLSVQAMLPILPSP
jgi:hypothetical protein